jgi:hypothetical protein
VPVLVHNPQADFKDSLGMDISYGRTKLHGTSGWSSFANAAIKIGNDVWEIHGEDPPMINSMKLHLDLDDANGFAFPMSLGSFSLTVQQCGPHSCCHIIHLGKEFVDVEVESHWAKEFTGVVGLLGSYTYKTNLARDGTTVIEDPNEF